MCSLTAKEILLILFPDLYGIVERLHGGVGKQCVGSGYGCGPSTIRNIRLFNMQVIQKFFVHNQL